MSFHVPEKYRLHGIKGENDGVFLIVMERRPHKPVSLRVIASDGAGWEHVSVSLKHRTPRWEEMCYVKSIFWDSDDCVVQYHPPKSHYINNHPYCLHLWRPIGKTLLQPYDWMVGFKGLEVSL